MDKLREVMHRICNETKKYKELKETVPDDNVQLLETLFLAANAVRFEYTTNAEGEPEEIRSVQGHTANPVDTSQLSRIKITSQQCAFIYHSTTYGSWEKVRDGCLEPGGDFF